MVNNAVVRLSGVVTSYVVITVATVAALLVLSLTRPDLATPHAWGHGVLTAVFAVVLPMRMRSARAGHRDGLRAVGIICAVLLLVNVVEALIPGFCPGWMRIEMVGIAVVLATAVGLVVRAATATRP